MEQAGERSSTTDSCVEQKLVEVFETYILYTYNRIPLIILIPMSLGEFHWQYTYSPLKEAAYSRAHHCLPLYKSR